MQKKKETLAANYVCFGHRDSRGGGIGVGPKN
jgi:hypothetical protein